MSRAKVSSAEKIAAAQACIEGRIGCSEAAKRLKVNYSTMEEWVERYREDGEAAFENMGKNHIYSKVLKLAAVQDYLSGKGSMRRITAKYGLHSSSILRAWIKVYNSGKDFTIWVSRSSTP